MLLTNGETTLDNAKMINRTIKREIEDIGKIRTIKIFCFKNVTKRILTKIIKVISKKNELISKKNI